MFSLGAPWKLQPESKDLSIWDADNLHSFKTYSQFHHPSSLFPDVLFNVCKLGMKILLGNPINSFWICIRYFNKTFCYWIIAHSRFHFSIIGSAFWFGAHIFAYSIRWQLFSTRAGITNKTYLDSFLVEYILLKTLKTKENEKPQVHPSNFLPYCFIHLWAYYLLFSYRAVNRIKVGTVGTYSVSWYCILGNHKSL